MRIGRIEDVIMWLLGWNTLVMTCAIKVEVIARSNNRIVICKYSRTGYQRLLRPLDPKRYLDIFFCLLLQICRLEIRLTCSLKGEDLRRLCWSRTRTYTLILGAKLAWREAVCPMWEKQFLFKVSIDRARPSFLQLRCVEQMWEVCVKVRESNMFIF